MSLVKINTVAKTGKAYWRSLDQLANTATFKEWVAQEFPGGTEMLEGDSRRTVLKLMAASFGLAGLTACRRPVDKILPFAKTTDDRVPGRSFYYHTAYVQGGASLGVMVEAVDGRPIKIEGNPAHPQSLGAAGTFAQASILNLYDPDRSKQVLENGKKSDWKKFGAFAASMNGNGLRILSERVTSPSLAAARTALIAKFPQAKWIEWEPISDEAASEGAKAVFGSPVALHNLYDKADVVLSLDSDFLCGDVSSVIALKRFSKRRKVESEATAMNRLYVVESGFTPTGAMADHRIRMRAADVDGFATALAAELGIATGELKVLDGGKRQKMVAAIARDLKKSAGKSIVVAGAKQPARVHALAALMNSALGNFGATVIVSDAASQSNTAALKELVGEMYAGRVSTLAILGGNPAYSAPSDLSFADAMKRVATTIHLGLDNDETAKLVRWHLPETHYLEAWGDTRALDGTVTIQQPLLYPLYGGKSALEVVHVLAGTVDPKGYDLVRNTSLPQWSAAEKDARWTTAVHDGMIASAAPVASKAVASKTAALPAATVPGSGVEINFVPSSHAYDGRFANNAWMQEAPDPITKIVWDDAALMAPAMARSLGVVNGDVISISRRGKTIEAPVMIQPGHADKSVTLALGMGRTEVGRIGKGAGFNAYPLRTSDALGFATDAEVKKTGSTYELVTTQEHHSMEGRPIVREASMEEYRKHPDFAMQAEAAAHMESGGHAESAAAHGEGQEHPSIYGNWDYSKGYQWGMSIDLNSCVGCNACLVACQAENNIVTVGKDQVQRGREMHWIRLDRYYAGSEDEPEMVNQPMPCQQCENAPCESVCPVAATTHSAEGLNEMVYNRCVGTRYCSNNCPYKVRRFNFFNYHKKMEKVSWLAQNPDVTVRMRGVMEKCTYCVQRIQEKKILAKLESRRAIRDGEILTACQQTCPADAIVFGDINDSSTAVSKEKARNRNYALLEEVNTRPRTTYLAKLRNPNPELG